MLKILKDTLLMSILVLAPVKAILTIIGILVMADLVSGILAAKKRKEKITSAGIRRTVTKFFVYETAIILGFLTEHYLTGALVPITKIISGLIGMTELKSVLENMGDIQGEPIFNLLIKKLGSDNDKIKGSKDVKN